LSLVNAVHIKDERWRTIRQFIIEIASGKFDLPEFIPKKGDVLDGIIQGMIMVAEELKASSVSRAYLDSVITGITDILFVLDDDFKVVEYNQAAQDFYGVDSNELLEQDFKKFLSDQPDIMDAIQSLVVKAQGKVENIRIELINSKAESVSFSASANYISSSNNPRYNVLVTARDISDLVETQRRLEESNSELTTLIYRLSHDIRSPLTNILGLTDLMLDFTKSLDEDNNIVFHSLLEKLTISATKIDSILHFFNRLSIIQSELGAEDISLKELFTNIENELSFKFEGVSVRFEYDLRVDAIKMNCTRLLLTLIVLQVLENSFIYRQPERQLWLGIQSEMFSRDVVLTISDNGKGIPENIKADVFNMFVRGHNNQKHAGMGLFFVKSAINQIMGKVQVHSHEGLGTSVVLRIPVVKPTTAKTSPHS